MTNKTKANKKVTKKAPKTYTFFGKKLKPVWEGTDGAYSLYLDLPFGTAVELSYTPKYLNAPPTKDDYEAFFVFPVYKEIAVKSKSGEDALKRLEAKVLVGFKPLFDLLGVKV